MHKKKYDERITGGDIILFLILGLLALSIIIPFWNVLCISFSTAKEAADNPLMIFPSEVTLENYRYLFEDGKILSGYKNIVFENGQGLLLDQNNTEYYPHLTPSNTGAKNVLDIIC